MRAQELICDLLAPSRSANYFNKVGEFTCFCHDQGLQINWPVPVENILRFMLHMHEKGLKPLSVSIYLIALAFMAGFLEEADNTKNFEVKKMLEAMRQARPPIPDKFRSITVRILRGLVLTLSRICSLDFEVQMFRTVLVMFCGGLLSK